MPPQQEEQGPIIKPVKLFESGHRGSGDAIAITEHRYHRIHGSIDARWPGQFRMGLQVSKLATNTHGRTPVWAAEWVDTNLVSPIIFYVVDGKLMEIQFGAVAEVGTNLLIGGAGANSAAYVRTAALDDNGSGVPYIYVGFGPNSTLDVTASNTQVIRRIAVDQSISAIADVTGTIYADKLLSLNGRLYRTIIPSGGSHACSVSVCPLGADRMDSANWSAGQVAGFAGTSINALVNIRLAPVAVKPEGIFTYVESAWRWVNRTPSWERRPHARNGVGAFSLGDRLVVPMGDGGAVIYDGYNIIPFDPHGPASTPNQHTTGNMFMSAGTLAQNIAAATVVSDGAYASPKAISAGSNMRVFEDATDRSAAARDGSLATTFIMGVGEAMYIGWERPFVGVHIGLTGANSAAGTLTVAVSDGATGWNTIGHTDFTQLPNGTTLGQSGGIIMTADPVATQSWLTDTVNAVSGLYWVRITGFPGNATIANVQLIPWVPSINNTDYPLDGLDRSGSFPHILLGDSSQRESVWHDFATIPEPDALGAVLYCNVGGSSLNRYRALVGVGRFGVWRIDVQPDDHAGTLPHPYLNEVGLFEGSSVIPNPGKLSKILAVRIYGMEFDPNLVMRFYYAWDYGKPWNQAPGAALRAPYELKIEEDQRGYLFRWAIGWTQGSDTSRPTQPAVTYVEADFEMLEEPVDAAQERSMATPPRF